MEFSPDQDHMAQHIHLPQSVTAGLKSADVAVLRQEVGFRGNGIKEGFQGDKRAQAREPSLDGSGLRRLNLPPPQRRFEATGPR